MVRGSHCVGLGLCYHVLKFNESIESRTTVQYVTQDDLELPGTKEHMQLFDTTLIERLNDDNFKLKEGKTLIYEDVDLMEYESDNLDFLKPTLVPSESINLRI